MKRCIIMVCVLAIVWTCLPVFAVADSLEDALLGTVSQKYESNGDPATISGGVGDAGGASFGAYQFSSNAGIPFAFANWCISTGKDAQVGNRLVTAYQTDGNAYGQTFKTEWKAIAAENADHFLDLQHDYIGDQYYQKAVVRLRDELGLEISHYGIAFKNAVWSRSVQHGVGGFMTLMERVAVTLNGQLLSVDEAALITALYEESGAVVDSGTNPMTAKDENGNDRSNAAIIRKYGLEGKYMKYYSRNSANVQAGVYLRLRVNELADLLTMLATYGGYTQSGDYGLTAPVVEFPHIVLTDGDRLSGFYASDNTKIFLDFENKVGGTSGVRFAPKAAPGGQATLQGDLRFSVTFNATACRTMELQLYLSHTQTAGDALCRITVNEQEFTYPLTNLKEGWHTLSFDLTGRAGLSQITSLQLRLENLLGYAVVDQWQAECDLSLVQTAMVKADALNCRVSPSTDGQALGQFTNQTQVLLLGSDVNGWMLCYGINRDGQPMLGWCSGDYLVDRAPIQGYDLGDVDQNGQVQATDALWVLQSVVGKRTLTEEQSMLADMDEDFIISAKDALYILRKVVGKDA